MISITSRPCPLIRSININKDKNNYIVINESRHHSKIYDTENLNTFLP